MNSTARDLQSQSSVTPLPEHFSSDKMLSQPAQSTLPAAKVSASKISIVNKPIEVAYQSSLSTKLLILNSKGGCGKSTFTMALCQQLLEQDKKVEIIDLDQQQTTSHWGNSREGLRATHFQFQRGRYFSLAVRVLKGTDVTVIDTPSSFNHDDLGRYLGLAQKVIIPIQPTGVDIHAALNFIHKLMQHPIYKQRKPAIALVATRCLSPKQFTKFEKVFSHLNLTLLGYMSADIAYIEQFDTDEEVVSGLDVELDKALWQAASDWVSQSA